MKAVKYLDQDIIELVFHCFYKVYNTLGYGFLERVPECFNDRAQDSWFAD